MEPIEVDGLMAFVDAFVAHFAARGWTVVYVIDRETLLEKLAEWRIPWLM